MIVYFSDENCQPYKTCNISKKSVHNIKISQHICFSATFSTSVRLSDNGFEFKGIGKTIGNACALS